MRNTTTKHLFSILLFIGLLPLFITASHAALSENTNLISNPGFESGSTGWPSNSSFWGVVTGTAHSGNASMRLKNGSTSSYPIISRSIPVQTDCRYKISVWVKTQSVSGTDSGATIALEYYDGNGNYIPGGCYPAGIKGTSNWTKISAITDRMPSNVRKIVFLMYMRKGCTGTAWFDDTDVEVAYDYLFRPLIIHPHYRNNILPGQTKRLILGVQAAGNSARPTSTLAIDVTLTDPSGLSSKVSALPDPSSDKWQSIYVNLPGTTPGTYRITASLVDAATRAVLQSKDLSFVLSSPTAPMPKVYIDNLNRCVADGQQFFPLGFYCWGTQSEASAYLNRLSGTKFNCLMNYTVLWYPLKGIKSFLDTASQKGIKVIFSVKDCYEGSQWAVTQAGSWSGSFNVLKGMVNTYKSHPALLAWYLNDELSGTYLPAITDRYNYIASNDYNHPVWQVLYRGQNLSAHTENTDVMGVDNYPVWNSLANGTNSPQMETFGMAAEDTRKATMGARGIWMVPECCSIESATTPNSQPPTYEEIMCEAYQALTSGARGLIFYNLTELLNNDGEDQWNVMKHVGDDLYSIKPVVLGTDVSATSVTDSRISLITRSANGAVYILAVNPSEDAVSASFTLGSGVSARSAVVSTPGASQRTLAVNNGAFVDQIGPLGIRVYMLAN